MKIVFKKNLNCKKNKTFGDINIRKHKKMLNLCVFGKNILQK